jgi:hypothetical protein
MEFYFQWDECERAAGKCSSFLLFRTHWLPRFTFNRSAKVRISEGVHANAHYRNLVQIFVEIAQVLSIIAKKYYCFLALALHSSYTLSISRYFMHSFNKI